MIPLNGVLFRHMNFEIEPKTICLEDPGQFQTNQHLVGEKINMLCKNQPITSGMLKKKKKQI